VTGVRNRKTNTIRETGSIKFDLQKVLLAIFTSNDDNKSLFEEAELKLAISLIESENISEDTISFHPFSARVTTDTKGNMQLRCG
jgi:hypothetical protein